MGWPVAMEDMDNAWVRVSGACVPECQRSRLFGDRVPTESNVLYSPRIYRTPSRIECAPQNPRLDKFLFAARW